MVAKLRILEVICSATRFIGGPGEVAADGSAAEGEGAGKLEAKVAFRGNAGGPQHCGVPAPRRFSEVGASSVEPASMDHAHSPG